MREVSREWLEFLREQYPKGSRVRLTKMGNDPHPIPPGSMGTLKYIDDIGQFHVKWDNGRGLALIIGEDQFQILPPEPQTIKFYMPLTAQLYAYDDWGDLEEYGNDLDGSELRDYQSCIHEALLENQMPEEKNRGLMHWYDKPDGVNTKVQSVMLDVESRDGQLWGVAECKVNGTLLPEEKEALAEYISGQASDGWGEGFEQRAIKLNDGELYVSLWNSSNWSIQTEEERFSPDSLTRLPDLCWSVLPGEGTLICIKRGESGYYPSDWSTKDRAQNRWLADYKIMPVYIAKQQLDTFATELVREAELYGRVGTETTRRAQSLREQTGLDPDISWSSTGRIQLNQEITVVLTYETNLGLFAGFGSFPITLRSEATGKSEVYWK